MSWRLAAPLVALLALAAAPWWPRTRGAPPLLRATFLDVGQGDACVIEMSTRQGRRVVVVDGGGCPGTDEREGGDPGSRVVVPYLRHRGITTVDWIVPTHPDDDHVQGLIAVAQRLPVRAVLDGGHGGDSAAYARLRDRLRRKRIPLHSARRGGRIDLGGGARLEILHPRDRPLGGARSDTNANSIVLRLVYGKARLLLTGDAEAAAEADLLASGGDLAADVLKVGHHGSRDSTSEPFLARVRPRIAVLSCGRDNVYGHPHAQVLERLQRRGILILRTDRQGAATIETDGRRIRAIPTVASPAATP